MDRLLWICNGPSDFQCPICLETDTNQSLYTHNGPPGHVLHLKCLKVWKDAQEKLNRRFCCPVCRGGIDELPSLSWRERFENSVATWEVLSTPKDLLDFAQGGGARRSLAGLSYEAVLQSSKKNKNSILK